MQPAHSVVGGFGGSSAMSSYGGGSSALTSIGGYQANNMPGGKFEKQPGGSAAQASAGGKFRRYNLSDIFDEQFGLLQRNDILEGQKLEDKKNALSSGAIAEASDPLDCSASMANGSTLNLFVVDNVS